MHKLLLFLWVCGALAASSCAVRLAALPAKTPEQVQAAYRVSKDVAYGPDPEQTLDLYQAAATHQLRQRDYTIVFLHGGGYYTSDKAKEERYIQPYLQKGLNVVNLNYRLKRGIPLAAEDLTTALNFLQAQKATYPLRLDRVILTGFSAGAHIASLVAVTANAPAYPHPLAAGIQIAGVVNFSGPVDGLDVVEQVFMDNKVPLMHQIGVALFPASLDYAPKALIRPYEPITYFDKQDPPFFIWHGGQDDQVPPGTFTDFVAFLQQNPRKNEVLYVPQARHSPTASELQAAYAQIFQFLDRH
ncbi:MAG: alpha/beta hydrolase [Hymenobacter sp.]|nr:MAG: alpha/beta hydrolase [Hymenobacter sp.]